MNYQFQTNGEKILGGEELLEILIRSVPTLLREIRNLGDHRWNYFTRGDEKQKANTKQDAIIVEEPCELENHLANHCTAAPNEVIREYLAKLLSHNPDGSGFNNKNNKENN
ncbi:hypothetical protein C1645_739342 [Glomus cerebriforme]|uniref:Uncharacterized protein n=1 Tax=Glomus cerebriforme TaxID=658196 RepID=A0A397T035_9GLOM|nr:hypothetical protein C1645_739342 [Glomus cerebriforme]